MGGAEELVGGGAADGKLPSGDPKVHHLGGIVFKLNMQVVPHEFTPQMFNGHLFSSWALRQALRAFLSQSSHLL